MEFRFVEEYLQDSSNATKAAIRAGYAMDSAKVTASVLLKKPKVKSAIAKAQKEGAKICGITEARILQELALIAFAKPGDVIRMNSEGEADIDLNDLTKDAFKGTEINVSTSNSGGRKSRVVSVKTVKVSDKVKALETIGKHLGMFKEQLEVTHNNSLKDLIEQSFIEEPEKPVVN